MCWNDILVSLHTYFFQMLFSCKQFFFVCTILWHFSLSQDEFTLCFWPNQYQCLATSNGYGFCKSKGLLTRMVNIISVNFFICRLYDMFLTLIISLFHVFIDKRITLLSDYENLEKQPIHVFSCRWRKFTCQVIVSVNVPKDVYISKL